MNIRPAASDDFNILYEIGKSTHEFRVSAKEVFMDADEFRFGVIDPHSVFLLAEHNSEIIGFIYASALDHDKPLVKQSACLIYITTLPDWRGKGVAKDLYQKCEEILKDRGISGIYVWANTEGDGSILSFLEKEGFAKGHQYVWMDKEIM